jgi:hypothetical protein
VNGPCITSLKSVERKGEKIYVEEGNKKKEKEE